MTYNRLVPYSHPEDITREGERNGELIDRLGSRMPNYRAKCTSPSQWA